MVGGKMFPHDFNSMFRSVKVTLHLFDVVITGFLVVGLETLTPFIVAGTFPTVTQLIQRESATNIAL